MFDKKTQEELQSIIPELPVIIGEKSLHRDIDDLVLSVVPVANFAVIDDINTNQVFGNKIFSAIKNHSSCTHITLASDVEATDEAVNYIRKKTAKCDALIAVGGGTINDLCKYAAHLDGKPYIAFPTAASMNGYLSANASINIHGHKTTFSATLPKAVFCDFNIIASAPLRLSKSGLGDSLARPTAQADWLLSHLLLNTNYDERPFTLLKDTEAELFASADGIAKGDYETIKTLMKLLLLSGIGMTIAGGSYPASQAEHMIAHTYNMLKKSQPVQHKTLHGEEIAVTSLYMAMKQQTLLNTMPRLRREKFDMDIMTNLFGGYLAEKFKDDFAKKQKLIEQNCHNLNKASWNNIREKLEQVVIMPEKIENILKQSQSSTAPKAIGWNEDNFITACNTAHFTRDRFTFLDCE